MVVVIFLVLKRTVLKFPVVTQFGLLILEAMVLKLMLMDLMQLWISLIHTPMHCKQAVVTTSCHSSLT